MKLKYLQFDLFDLARALKSICTNNRSYGQIISNYISIVGNTVNSDSSN